MDQETTDLLNQAATEAVNKARASWEWLVEVSLRLPEDRIDSGCGELAKHMRQSKDNLKRKVLAIRYQHENLGHSKEEILEMGQEAVLSRHNKERKAAQYEKTAVMKWNIPGSLRELIRQDVNDVMWILGLKTSEELWDFLHSILTDLTANPDSLKQLAGELDAKKLGSTNGQVDPDAGRTA